MIEETIAAIATPSGEGGIGIIRISGSRAKEIAGAMFTGTMNPRELTYGHVKNPETGEIIDEVLLAYMPAPATYTREDVVEIDCHGGPVAMGKILEQIITGGARMAEPGEFTKRAFLNGRIDLSQAEAVLDVINAKTQDSLSAAIDQLQGKFSEEIGALRRNLTDILVDIDVNIDYPDEDIEELTYSKLVDGLNKIRESIEAILKDAEAGRILRDGLQVAIIGKPNAGKSSLLNLLLREARAIVTDIPGTTRDTIEEFANVKGIPVKLTDTAGIRDTSDEIERMGIQRSQSSMEAADLIILVIDQSEPLDKETLALIDSVEKERTIILFNKADKKEKNISKEEMAELSQGFVTAIEGGLTEGSIIEEGSTEEILAEGGIIEGPEKNGSLKKDTLKKIEEAIFRFSGYGEKKGKTLVTNVRHRAMLSNALTSIKDAVAGVKEGAPLEIIEIDVRNAYEELGFITGDSVQEDIIEEIFSRFCLGK